MTTELDDDISILDAPEVKSERVSGLCVVGGRITGRNHEDEMQSLRESNRLLREECLALKDIRSANLNECSRLRDQVSTLFQENCSLKEHSAKLAIESKTLKKQVVSVKEDNIRLRERLQQFSQQLKGLVQNKERNPVVNQQHIEDVKTMLDLVNSFAKINNTDGPSNNSSLTGRDRQLSFDETKDVDSSRRSLLPFPLDLDHESLEQISHKLLEHLQQEKRELEQQYTQMVEIQKSPPNYSRNAIQPAITTSSAGSGDTIVVSYLDSCRNSSRLLKQEAKLQNRLLTTMIQQLSLSKTLESVSHEPAIDKADKGSKEWTRVMVTTSPIKLQENLEVCSDALSWKATTGNNLDVLLEMYDNNHVLGWADVPSEGRECAASADDDRICPMCQAVFPSTIPLPEFEAHVMEHFRSEDFEIITHETGYS